MTISLHKNCIPFLFSNVYKTKAIHFFNGQQTCLKYDRKHKIIREIIIKFHTMEQMVNLLQRAVCNDLFLFVSKDYFNACGAQPFFHNSRGLFQRCSEGSTNYAYSTCSFIQIVVLIKERPLFSINHYGQS